MTLDEGRREEATLLSSRAREPAVVRNVLFGTAGWTEPSLIKSHLFYPKGVSTAKARLEHYARHFSLVEVDATYYSLLPREMAERWVTFTPPTFRFDVKAHPVLTGHPIDVSRLPSDLKDALPQGDDSPRRIYPKDLPRELAAELESRFRDFLVPLSSAGRLGCVLLQFPPWFAATRGNVRELEVVAERLSGTPIGVEFRNRTWLDGSRRDRVLSVLRRLGASYVAVDEPDVPIGGVPSVTAVTNPRLSIVRFHGRNVAGWRRGAPVSERFDYLYSEAELSSWVAPVAALAAESETVHAVFNNCVRNYAVVNAKGLSVLVAGDERRGGGRADGISAGG